MAYTQKHQKIFALIVINLFLLLFCSYPYTTTQQVLIKYDLISRSHSLVPGGQSNIYLENSIY